ncbi:hypothetical protein MycrhDRAFT_5765 [Mycolicibacterium rhodesiae JS60]|nr:hypothetical protein MycrhDRAFT_5765 [Mycolicibacterium rhodesiae JS60]
MEPRVFSTLDEVPEGVVVTDNQYPTYWKFEEGVRYMDLGVEDGVIIWDGGEQNPDNTFLNRRAPFTEVLP